MLKIDSEEIGKPRFLAVDEISLKNRHCSLTVVVDWESGRVLRAGDMRPLRSSLILLLMNKGNPC